uniref:Ovule protein n=1 Tax=Heterorhabditis bacteriophora TaxID=37862 RepID=A0A1I7W872_HETBA
MYIDCCCFFVLSFRNDEKKISSYTPSLKNWINLTTENRKKATKKLCYHFETHCILGGCRTFSLLFQNFNFISIICEIQFNHQNIFPLSMAFCHLSGNFRISSLTNDSALEAMELSIHFRTSLGKYSPRKNFLA